MTLSSRQLFALLFVTFTALLAATALQAWTGPTATAPGSNVPAPLNVGSTDQVKNGGLSLNSLLVSGNAAIYNSAATEKLGINTASPVVALDVNGSVKIGNGGEVCQGVSEGTLRYNFNSHQPEYCDGVSWKILGSASSPGSQTFATPGTYQFTVPSYSSLTITVSGGGGGGGGGFGYSGSGGSGTAGSRSSFNTSLYADGGGGGAGDTASFSSGANGSPGTASGGDTNTTGGGPAGGQGGASGDCQYGSGYKGGDGGAGGKAVKTYAAGDLTVGASVPIVVGAMGIGGAGGAGNIPTSSDPSYCSGVPGTNGSAGTVTISWQ